MPAAAAAVVDDRCGGIAATKKTIGERLLSPIAEVRREEVASALLLTLIMFLILAAYYMLKTAREVFILGEGGAEVKSYSSAGQALLLLVLVPAYGAFASRVNRIQLVQWVTLFFASHLALFLLALSRRMARRRAVFPVAGHLQPDGDRAVLGVCQRPLHARARQARLPADRRRQQPRRVGRIGARRADRRPRSGTDRLLVAAARDPRGLRVPGEVGVCARRGRVAAAHAPAAADEEKPLGKQDGFAMIFGDRYLMLIAALAVILNVVNTSGEYLFGRYVVEMANATHGTRSGGRGGARGLHRRHLQPVLQHGQPGRLRHADVRGVTRDQVPRRGHGAVHSSRSSRCRATC